MKRKAILQRIADVRDNVLRGVPHDLTFKPVKGTKKEVAALQRSLDYHFDLWRRSWILPVLDQIEELVKEKKS